MSDEEAQALAGKLKVLMRSVDEVDQIELINVCEKLLFNHPAEAAKCDALFPIWRYHYDRIVAAEAELRKMTDNGRLKFETAIDTALSHLQRITDRCATYSNTRAGKEIMCKCWIYRGDCERYRERNPVQTAPFESHSLTTQPRIPAYTGALSCYSHARRIQPDFGVPYNSMGVVYEGKRDWFLAAYSYLRAARAKGKPFKKAIANIQRMAATIESEMPTADPDYLRLGIAVAAIINERNEAAAMAACDACVAHLKTALVHPSDQICARLAIMSMLFDGDASPSPLSTAFQQRLLVTLARFAAEETRRIAAGNDATNVAALSESLAGIIVLLLHCVGTQADFADRAAVLTVLRIELERLPFPTGIADEAGDEASLPENIELDGVIDRKAPPTHRSTLRGTDGSTRTALQTLFVRSRAVLTLCTGVIPAAALVLQAAEAKETLDADDEELIVYDRANDAAIRFDLGA